MKKFLLLTDFSANATNAAEYCYSLASQIRADIALCNIVTIPTDTLLAAAVAWPVYDYNVLMDNSAADLKRLAKHLENRDGIHAFKPGITAVNKDGSVPNTINELVEPLNIDMVVMGTHNSNGLNTFIMGDHAKEMIDATKLPLLLVPGNAKFRQIKKMAYATDFSRPKEDLAALFHLISIAKLMNAEILIVHAYKQTEPVPLVNKPLDSLLVELSNKANYSNIYYRIVQSRNPETGLDWLCEHGQVDILVMLHRPKSFLEELFKDSYTKKMAHHTNIPLLVFPESMAHE